MLGQTAEQTSPASADEAARRAEWLKSIGASAPPQPTSQSAASFLKKRFAETRGQGIRLPETPAVVATPSDKPAEETAKSAPPAKASRIAESPSSDVAAKSAHPAATKSAETPPATVVTNGKPANVKPADSSHHEEGVASAKPATTPSPKPSPASTTSVAAAKPTPAHVGDLHAAASPSPKPSTTAANVASAKPAPATRPSELHSLATPAPKSNLAATQSESITSAKLSLEPHIAGMRVMSTPYPSWRLSNTRPDSMSGHYQWKSGIVTTVFWIGEPTSENNPTPNRASSWDTNWTQSYGGYDNPHAEARRNFMPVSFIPRQNPFYVALPYNDVTHGTTKPEARLVIPWFRESFRKEGQSVCRDRWVAIRGRDGRVAFAQWSDCGPFRTDHWQYVFGMERPRPNLNGGAGLDVSPAVRDYLGLQGTDITDWRFCEAREVPNGPWTLYGDNNPLARYRSRTNQAAFSPAALDVAANRRPF